MSGPGVDTGIVYRVGDATRPVADGAKIIAHICNDRGGWGRGFVRAISGRWPEPEREYRAWWQNRPGSGFALGATQLVEVEDRFWIANMVAQRGYRVTKAGPPLRVRALAKCLRTVADHALANEASVHMPRIGTGLAGGKWSDVEPLLVSVLVTRDVPLTVYDLK